MGDKQEMTAFDAGFEFARRMASSDFRKFLKVNGWASGMATIMATDEEPFVDIIGKMIFHETGERAFVAIHDETQPFGFRLLTVEVLRKRDFVMRPRLLNAEKITLGPGASVGMIYDAFGSCGTYVPNDWTRTLLVEKAAAC